MASNLKYSASLKNAQQNAIMSTIGRQQRLQAFDGDRHGINVVLTAPSAVLPFEALERAGMVQLSNSEEKLVSKATPSSSTRVICGGGVRGVGGDMPRASY